MVFEIKDKTFIVTGGASGMGALYAGKFLDQGAKGVAILDIAVDQGKALAEKHNKNYPGKAIFIKCDVSSEDEIAKAFDEVVAKFKQVDVIINNAGVMSDAPDLWRKASDVNWQGVVSFTLKGIKHMSKAEGGLGGTIVNIASIAGITKNAFMPIYCGSKSAVIQFCQCLAMDPFYTNTGVRILCVCFGATDTPLLHNLDKRAYDPSLGHFLHEYVVENHVVYQKVESAMAAVDFIIKNGANGSTWLSTDDKPAKDITSVIDQAFDLFDKVVTDNAVSEVNKQLFQHYVDRY